jgi:serine/threonine protein kinase
MFVHLHNLSPFLTGSPSVQFTWTGWVLYQRRQSSFTWQSFLLLFVSCTRNTSCTGSQCLKFDHSNLLTSRHSNRDIKPDNILLDERGHAHLTDFNIAVHYSDRRLLTGVAGSMAYMAPEILHKRGYTYPIDWWSLGVCGFELLFGRRPFRGRTNTALTHSISKDALRFPENAEQKCSTVGLNFISKVRFPLLPAPFLTRVLSFAAPGEGSLQTHCV